MSSMDSPQSIQVALPRLEKHIAVNGRRVDRGMEEKRWFIQEA